MRLILAPHADDESLGCGGLIAKAPQQCIVAVLSDKGDGRLAEFQQARKILQYDQHRIAPFITGRLMQESRALTTWLDGLIREIKPLELYLPTPGAHQDHLGTYEAGVRAARLSYTTNAWYVPSVYLYEIPSYTTDLYTIPYAWNRFEGLTEEQMNTKMAAIMAYRSQSNGSFDPADFAKEHARFIGASRNLPFAEQYAVVRNVIQ